MEAGVRAAGGIEAKRGLRLLPRLVAPLLTAPTQALWLLPTPGFRQDAFESRGSLWEIANKTSDPETALHNLLERDRMFTEHLHLETKRLGLNTITVEVNMTEDALVDRVARALGL